MTAAERAYELLLDTCNCAGDLNENDVFVIDHTYMCPLGAFLREERGE